MHRAHGTPKKSEHLPGASFSGRSGAWLAVLGAAAVALFSCPANAQPAPANNTCSSATRLDLEPGPVTINGTTVNATNDGDSTCGVSNDSPDVWYIYTARGSGLVSVDTCGSAFDTVLSVHTGCPGTVSNTLACNDNAATGDCAGGRTSSLSFNAMDRGTYLIRVSGFQNASGPFILRAKLGSEFVTPPPSNDACSGARTVGYGVHSYSTLGTIADGPGGPATDCLTSIREDVWFRWTACTNGQVSLDTCSITPWDTVIGVYDGDCSALSPVACNDNDCGMQSVVRFNASAGKSYLVRVGVSPNALYQGSGTLRLVGPLCPPPPPPVPANNHCSAATNLGQIAWSGTIATIDGTTINATNDGSASCGSSSTAPDVWYRFQARGAGPITFDTCGSTYDTVLSAHTGCPGTVGNSLACNDDDAVGACAGSPTSSISFHANDGASYWIRVAGYRGRTGTFTLRWTRSSNGFDGRPGNDLCSGAQTVGYGAHAYNTIGAGTDGPAGLTGDCVHDMRHDVWFRFTACATGLVTAHTCTNTIWDSMISVYAGSCAAPALIACNNDGCGVQSSTSFNAAVGATYFIRVGVNPTSPYRGAGVLTISGPGCPPPPPVNDLCSNASHLGMFQASTTMTVVGNATYATNDGATSCGASNSGRDVWYSFRSQHSGVVTIDTCGASFDTVLSVHSTCDGSAANTLACSDNAANGPCPGGTSSYLTLNVATHGDYRIRVAGNGNAGGPFALHVSYAMGLVGGPERCACDWDRDGSLTSADFYAFLNDFMSAASDFNYSGDVNSQDLFDYLDCFMTAPGACAS